MRAETIAFKKELIGESGEGPEPIHGMSLTDYAELEVEDSETLLGNRFLCRGGALAFVGPSGIGKSTASVQQDALWALGKPAFGIHPARPLRILTIQAENDDGDMIEFARGVLNGMSLTFDEREQIRKNTFYVPERSRTGDDFIAFVEACIKQYRPDLLRIDPLMAYLGVDPRDPGAMMRFTRNGLGPLLVAYRCGLILNHHTPKTNYRDTTKWKSNDWMYAGAGGADLTNWCRAVVVIDVFEGDPHLFRFIAAKRGGRIGWTNSDGSPTCERCFRHSRELGAILWVDANPSELATMTKRRETKGDILNLVPCDGLIEKNALLSHAQDIGIGVNRARGYLAQLIAEGKVFVHLAKRKGTNPLQTIARHPPQSSVDLHTP